MDKYFKAENHGWISSNNHPNNVRDVVVLIYDNEEEVYHQVMGYYENKWFLRFEETDNYKVIGWFPIPYSPNN